MLWVILVAGCLFLGWQTWSRRGTSSFTRKLVGLVAALACFAAAVWFWPGVMILQKVITGLVMPCSVIWVLLIGIVLLAWGKSDWRLRYASVTALVLYTLFGNLLVSWALMSWLEADYRNIDAMREGPFDVVIVLGGGLGEGPNGQMRLDNSGDRVMLGARLYLSGRTERIGCTGARIIGYTTEVHDQAEIAVRIFRDLGIPESDVIRLSGRNTLEEISAIDQLVRQHDWKRVGLVTSASHMRRAMRLADRAGVELEPLPADFKSSEPNWWQWLCVPRAEAFRDSSTAVKEILAVWVGR